MSKVGSWSTTASNNNASPPDGWPEGQAPSTVNDCAREMMASIRTFVDNLPFVDLNNTPSFLTSTTFSLGAADTSHFEVGRRIKCFDGGNTFIGTIDSVSATFVSVNLDSGALTASLSSVAVSIIGATEEALPSTATRPNKNTMINGRQDFWQRGSGFSPANGSVTYTSDRFAWIQSASAAVRITKAERSASTANVPTVAQASAVYVNSLHISVSAADASIAAGEFAALRYIVEGYDWAHIAHQSNCLSFWANTNRSGVYAVALYSTDQSAFYVQSYTLGTINTWTKVSITVPAAPTNVTWNYTNGVGVGVLFTMAAGSNLQGGAGGTGASWTSAVVYAGSTQQNFLASAGNVFMITGIKLEVGTSATDPEPYSYQDELNRVERYYEKSYPIDTDPGSTAASQGAVCVIWDSNVFSIPGYPWRTRKRFTSAGTVTIYRPSTGSQSAIELTNNSVSWAVQSVTYNQCQLQNLHMGTSLSTTTSNVKYHYTIDSDFS